MLEFSKLGMLKSVAELAASTGAGVVVGNLIRATTPEELTKVQKVLVGIGAYTIGGVLGDLSAKYVTNQIDSYANKVSALLQPKTVEEPLAEWELDLKESGYAEELPLEKPSDRIEKNYTKPKDES